MKREREELRRGLRSFIQDAGAELADFTNGSTPAATKAPESVKPAAPARPPVPVRTEAAPEHTAPAREPVSVPPAAGRLEQPIRPILKLVRDAPPPEPSPQPTLEEMTLHLPKKGVCAAYFANKRCWELQDAYCNHALHVCRLRECPVYDLHREEMERRFAAKFKHLW